MNLQVYPTLYPYRIPIDPFKVALKGTLQVLAPGAQPQRWPRLSGLREAKAPGAEERLGRSESLMGSYEWGYKSPNMAYKYRYITGTIRAWGKVFGVPR